MNIPNQQQSAHAQPSYAERQFLHTETAAVKVPLMQSAVTGGIVFIVSIVIAFRVNAMDVITWPLVFGALTFGGMWFGLTSRWLILTKLEMALGKDLDGDHVIGKKQAVPLTVIRVENIEAGRYRSRDIRLSADEDKLSLLASGLANGRRFSEKEWTPMSKGFSTNEWRRLQLEMLRGGLIELKNAQAAQQGYVLTADGEEWQNKYAVPSPTEDDGGV